MNSMKRYIFGNWKTYKTTQEVKEFFSVLNQTKLTKNPDVVFGVAPVFVHLGLANQLERNECLVLAQDANYVMNKANTGTVSYEQLKDIGVNYVIIGHSERRKLFHESDELINQKVKTLLENKMRPILCIGETLEEYEANKTKAVLKDQLEKDLKGIDSSLLKDLIIAYEPVWAIGTGKTASSQTAQDAIAYIRTVLGLLSSKTIANELPILYGGSVTPDNVSELLAQKDINGALVGGASLDPHKFIQLIEAK
ncbi:Triosephosphate isomerase [Mycoplasmoides gallisepticum str. R(low)]|uniref:Triosephosphate isomerase n=1 Tax=Mycoplasmoides gallisepticum (strain R(low / passage 15 / clone 2)) TaxID=710127 RepID=TPIS_MYCGA|nr:triose-phosphate isomerase [Mycoplasmoides gallisepticum]Q7NAQ4.1 RecName: Full=Triosephosphate isomerase; Short=TIM; Short=TPI; AltName: Full=Triose-phosphate isomerase [Mycoplasmoides gallisepticum str. R(low)]AAP56931.1 Triosephosphate isomerase [Mycoplasmoides gallisepticum str. R(low)]ADC30795.1 Triosephosphate isomerase [Mycoplasmoides gallisepticum str. R(high)]